MQHGILATDTVVSGEAVGGSKGLKSLLVTLSVSFLSLQSRPAHSAFFSHSAIFLCIFLHISSLCIQLHPTILKYNSHCALSWKFQQSQVFPVKFQPRNSLGKSKQPPRSSRNLRRKVETTFVRFTTRPGLSNSRLATPSSVPSPPSSTVQDTTQPCSHLALLAVKVQRLCNTVILDRVSCQHQHSISVPLTSRFHSHEHMNIVI